MTRLDIRAKTADVQIRARQIVESCLPLDCFTEVFCNAYNEGKEYVIAYKQSGGYTTFGMDMNRGVLTK